MLIDSHLHIGLNNWTETVLLKYLDENQIEKAWVLTWDEASPQVPLYYMPLDIQVVKAAFKNHPDRIVPFYAPDPGRPDWKQKLTESLNDGFAGCGELKVSYRWNDQRMLPLLEYLNENKLPLIFHMEAARKIFVPYKDRGADWLFKRLINERFNGKATHLIDKIRKSTGLLNAYLEKHLHDFSGYLLDFKELESAVSTYTDIRFVSHGPHIWNNFSLPENNFLFHQKGKFTGNGKLWDMLEKHHNFYCDLSGFSAYNALTRDPSASSEFLRKNYKKLLYGTDNMDLGLKELILNMHLGEEQLEHILYKNAKSIIPS